MIRTIHIILVLIFIQSIDTSGQALYKISDIPDSLKENANVVYLLDEGSYEIKDANRAIFKSRIIVAILNAKGKGSASRYVGYDKLSKINSFKGSVYDQDGELIEKLKKSDLEDQSATSGGTIYDDNRMQYASLQQNDYPYIVEFETEKEYEVTYFVPNWYVLPGQNVSVQRSKFSISAPREFLPRVKIVNTDKTFVKSETDGVIRLDIEFSNLTAQKRELYGPSFNELRPMVYCSPSKFSYDGYSGDLSSWHSFGRWIADLNRGRSDLPTQTVQEIKKITDTFESKEDKIHAVYQYVQDKTRYVSIQLGIGGYQPFPASTVDELGYGDCKALSNYTHSLLKAIDIPSNYTLVYGGDDPPKLDPEFSDNMFNHAILCVPNAQDTVWLECTSQTNPFGYMGDFTGDRDVLLITDKGGKIVHTPIYTKEKNTQNTFAHVDMTKDGSAEVNARIVYSGLQHENSNLNRYLNKGEEELKKWVYKNTEIADFKINNFNFKIEKDKIPSITQSMGLDVPRLAKPNGKRVFLPLNLLNKTTSVPKKYEDRKTDLVLDFQGIDVDTIIYEIPQHLHTEYLPAPVEIESEFGKYNASAKFEDGKLTYIRKLEYNKGRFDKSLYEQYREYKKKIVKADKAKVVFIDKT